MLLTEKIQESQVEAKPFPLVVCRNVLPADLHSELKRGLPPLSDLLKGKTYPGNHRLNYSATNLAFNSRVGAVLRELVQEHLQQSFLDDVVRLLGGYIPDYFPDFEERFGLPLNLKAGIRPVDQDSDADVLLDCQLAVNTPVTIGGTTVRAPHVDCPKKLFVGLYYLRLDADDSTGGDLELYTPRSSEISLDETRTASVSDMQLVRRVPYESNTLVLFLNTPISYHGVTVRSRTPHHRLFINLLGEMREPLFNLSGATGHKSLSGRNAAATAGFLANSVAAGARQNRGAFFGMKKFDLK